jgi:hypothetical protein
MPSRPQEALGGSRIPPPVTSNGGNYYEDVDPRFAEPSPRTQLTTQEGQMVVNDDPHLAPGARSPAISERSGFTSVSQRGVNPHWNPPPGQGYSQQMPPRRPVNRNDVNILNSNPDFNLPARRGGSVSPARGSVVGGRGMVPGSAYPGA